MMQISDALIVIGLKKLLNKQSSGRWFEVPWLSCDATVGLPPWLNSCYIYDPEWHSTWEAPDREICAIEVLSES